MEAIVVRLETGDRWTYLGGQPGAKEPVDLVVRAFDEGALVAVGEGERAPDGEPVLVPAGQGRRISGWHFFARPADPRRGGRVTIRGL